MNSIEHSTGEFGTYLSRKQNLSIIEISKLSFVIFLMLIAMP